MRYVVRIISVLGFYFWEKRERKGTRYGYIGSFSWIFNVLFFKKMCEENMVECEFLKKLDVRCMGVYYIIFDNFLYF